MPDNNIQDPFNTQSFNRYGYVWNNPLSFNDPSGEVIWFAVAAIVGGYIGGAQANGTFNPLKWDWKSGQTWAGIGGGALVGVASMGIGLAVTGAVAPIMTSAGITGGILGYGLPAMAAGFVSGAFSGGIMSQLPGGNGDFFGGAWKGAVMGAATGFVIGGTIGAFKTPPGHSILTGKDLRPNVSTVSALDSKGITGFDDGIEIKAQLNDTEVTGYNNQKINANVNTANFESAKVEWNGIKQQYGIDTDFTFPDGFTKNLPDGGKIKAQFFQGGNSNPNGFTIKLNTFYPTPPDVKIPDVYIRYKLPLKK